jgi:hypothetical protein
MEESDRQPLVVSGWLADGAVSGWSDDGEVKRRWWAECTGDIGTFAALRCVLNHDHDDTICRVVRGHAGLCDLGLGLSYAEMPMLDLR